MIHRISRGEVLRRQSERFENRDLLRRGSTGRPSRENVADLPRHVVRVHDALGDRLLELASLSERRRTIIHKEARSRHSDYVNLARCGDARPY